MSLDTSSSAPALSLTLTPSLLAALEALRGERPELPSLEAAALTALAEWADARVEERTPEEGLRPEDLNSFNDG
ncbi:hypothetical protein [Mangrovibrevibacter kandeliae]|uniref:hypothetical protein n=1 Tax=Mangrovibrevibacter kandeliae TaxID=2968473 RepID=UPI002117C1F8|nr:MULTISPECIES: hypothetical protein [unclassified Aurantimonas]MCQ8782641.1 hypothetical protein [Aurantimonas sp. CSK15Z-1]MCW4114550.1 hypothetical protein [Aurantimonas sp. MSK8Z-1]